MGRTILVTGGAGFIGSNFVLQRIAAGDRVDQPRQAHLCRQSRQSCLASTPIPAHIFVHGGIEDATLVRSLLETHRPDALVNFAAESHVDRSIASPEEFIFTNVVGTFRLLHDSLAYYRALPPTAQARFRFLHVSTDEVYGSLGKSDPAFTETHAYRAQQPLLRLQGRQRSPGARLPPHLRAAYSHHQLLQQLRPFSVS